MSLRRPGLFRSRGIVIFVITDRQKFMNIVITGASKGIGHEVARILAVAGGHRVIAVSRNAERLNMLREQSGDRVRVIPFDLTADNIGQALVPEILDIAPNIDILVNNAGILISKPFAELMDDDWNRVFDTNARSAFRLSRALLPYFSAGAHIVNIGSMGGYQGSAKFPGLSLYSASKGALAILSECMAEELKDRDIRVNCLALGSAQTEMLESAFPGYKAPLSAVEMASFIADFALNGHRFFNGKVLPVSVATP